MTLTEYLETHGESQMAFARRTGISKSAVSRYVKGQQFPRKGDLLKIAAATACHVTANDFVGITPAEQGA